MRVEAQIYEMIGLHPRLPKIIEWNSETDCLTMEYIEKGNLSECIRENQSSGAITSELRLHWAKQAAEGLEAVHSIGAVHCDISQRNFLLDINLNSKISDLGGSSPLGSRASAAPGERFQAQGMDWHKTPDIKEDLFALGSLIYFIMTDKHPYEDIPSVEVVPRYERNEFPEVSHLCCGEFIKRCCKQQVCTAQEVFLDLEALEGAINDASLGITPSAIKENTEGKRPAPTST